MRSSFHTWHSLVSAVREKIFIRTMEELLKLPPQLKLCETKAYGRGVYATSDLVPGTEILVSEPFLHVVANDYRGSRCDVCLKSSEYVL